MLQGQDRNGRLDAAGRAQRMAGVALGAAAGQGAAVDGEHRFVFGGIVAGRASAVQVDAVNVCGLQAGSGQGAAHRCGGARAFGVRAAHVVAVAAFTGAQQPGCGVLCVALQQGKCRRFTQRQAGAVLVPGPADVVGHQLQALEAVQRGQTKAVDAAHHGSIDGAEFDQALCGGKHLGTG